MADNAFQFPGAPSSGVGRQFGAVAGVVSALKGSKGGLSARAQSGLMAQQHAHNLELESHKGDIAQRNATMSSVVGHVLGQEASATSHKQTVAQNRQANKHELKKSAQEHMQATDTAINAQNHEARMADVHHTNAVSAINNAAGNPAISAIKLPNGGSAQFRDLSAQA